jgi:hypothetical protein
MFEASLSFAAHVVMPAQAGIQHAAAVVIDRAVGVYWITRLCG